MIGKCEPSAPPLTPKMNPFPIDPAPNICSQTNYGAAPPSHVAQPQMHETANPMPIPSIPPKPGAPQFPSDCRMYPAPYPPPPAVNVQK